MTHRDAQRLEKAARKLVKVVPPENGWWGVRIRNYTHLHQSEASAVEEREQWVEWLIPIMHDSGKAQRAAIVRVMKKEIKFQDKFMDKVDRFYIKEMLLDLLAAVRKR